MKRIRHRDDHRPAVGARLEIRVRALDLVALESRQFTRNDRGKAREESRNLIYDTRFICASRAVLRERERLEKAELINQLLSSYTFSHRSQFPSSLSRCPRVINNNIIEGEK